MKKGELVWVRCGKADHPAFRVTTEPSIVEDGVTMHCVYWPALGEREYVEEDRIQADLGGRRKRSTPPPPVVSQTRVPNRGIKRIKKEEEDDNNDDDEEDKKPAAKVTNKSKRKINLRYAMDDNDDDTGSDRMVPDVVGSQGAIRRSMTARTMPAEHRDLACSPETMTALVNRLLKRAAKKARDNRRITDGDLVTYQGRSYVVTGFSSFHGRFAHITDQLELQCTARRERVHVPQEILRSDC